MNADRFSQERILEAALGSGFEPASGELRIALPAPVLFVMPRNVREHAYRSERTAPHAALVLDGVLDGRLIPRQVEPQYFVRGERSFLTVQLERGTWKTARSRDEGWRLAQRYLLSGSPEALDRFLDRYGVSIPMHYRDLSDVVLDASRR